MLSFIRKINIFFVKLKLIRHQIAKSDFLDLLLFHLEMYQADFHISQPAWGLSTSKLPTPGLFLRTLLIIQTIPQVPDQSIHIVTVNVGGDNPSPIQQVVMVVKVEADRAIN